MKKGCCDYCNNRKNCLLYKLINVKGLTDEVHDLLWNNVGCVDGLECSTENTCSGCYDVKIDKNHGACGRMIRGNKSLVRR